MPIFPRPVLAYSLGGNWAGHMNVADFLGKPRNRSASSTQAFLDIDLDGTARMLRLKERAAEAARLSLPTVDSQNFDATEYAVVHEMEADAKASLSKYLEDQKAYAERARDVASDAAIAKLKNTAKDAKAAFEGAVKSGKDEFYTIRREVRDAELDLARFREEHRLLRPARNQGKLTSSLLLLFFVLAVEAVLNGYFLSKGNTFGLAGGIFEAVFIAAMNISIGFVVGRLLLPWLFYRHALARSLAVIGGIGYLALALLFNLAVAHYRMAMIDHPFDAASFAYRTLLVTPFGMHDLEAWALLAMGCGFSLLAAYKGLNCDDPYPGYGARLRASLDALDEFNGLKDELLEELEEIKAKSERTMDDAIRSISSRAGEHAHIAAKSAARKEEVLSHFQHLQVAGRTLLQVYRDENLRCRKDGVVPSRFSEEWSFTPPDVEHVSIVPPMSPSAEADSKEALREAPTRREEMHEAYRVAIAAYANIEQVVGAQT